MRRRMMNMGMGMCDRESHTKGISIRISTKYFSALGYQIGQYAETPSITQKYQYSRPSETPNMRAGVVTQKV